MSFLGYIKNKYFPSFAEQLGYSDKDILVIINMDDVGLHKDETEASFSALDFGMVKTGSIMAPCPNFNQVIKSWKENPEIDLGVHLTLTCEWGEKYPWSPVLPKADVPSLYNEGGIMWSTVEDLLPHAKRKEIEMELEAQINKIVNAGLYPTHIDYHMHWAYYSDLFLLAMKLSRKYNLPLRPMHLRRYRLPFIKNNLSSLRRKGFAFPDTQMGLYITGNQKPSLDFWKKKYLDYFRSLIPGVHNIKVHLAFHTSDLNNLIGYHSSLIRQIDYEVWTSEDVKKTSADLGITFIGFRPLQELQKKLICSKV